MALNIPGELESPRWTEWKEREGVEVKLGSYHSHGRSPKGILCGDETSEWSSSQAKRHRTIILRTEREADWVSVGCAGDEV